MISKFSNIFGKKTFYAILFFEIACVLIVGAYLYTVFVLKKNIFGTKIVNSPISKDNINSTSSAELKYYYEYKPNTYENYKPDWAQKKVVFTINADTFNERFDYPIDKPPNTYRIIALGDSYTFGLGVDTKDNWPEQLEDQLNKNINCNQNKKFEVINLAMSGYGVEYISHRYLTRGIKYKPDLIIWFEPGYGFDRINEIFTPYSKELESTTPNKEIGDAIANGNYQPISSLAYKKMYENFTYAQLSNMCKVSWQKFFYLRGNTPVIIATPNSVSNKNLDQLRLWIEGHKNITLDITGLQLDFKKLQLPDGHPNVEGHRLIANNLFQYLTENNKSLMGCD
jgi:lysophospholipase L1-like esterase